MIAGKPPRFRVSASLCGAPQTQNRRKAAAFRRLNLRLGLSQNEPGLGGCGPVRGEPVSASFSLQTGKNTGNGPVRLLLRPQYRLAAPRPRSPSASFPLFGKTGNRPGGAGKASARNRIFCALRHKTKPRTIRPRFADNCLGRSYESNITTVKKRGIKTTPIHDPRPLSIPHAVAAFSAEGYLS